MDETYSQPLASYYKGTEVVTLASGKKVTDSCIAISGGKGTATSHDHIDSGAVLIEKNGLRFIGDSGAEHYAATSYFSTNRFWYYKARPEGHSIFVINPQNLFDSNGTSYYMGQSKSGVSEITEYKPDEKSATMDLSAAYARDALSASRKISLDGDKIIIEDDISLRSDALPDESVNSDASIRENGNVIEWYWHYKDTATAVVNNTTKYGATDYGTVQISDDGKSATLIFRDYEYKNSRFTYPGTVKKFTLTFESNADFEIEVRDAVRNPYDANEIAKLQAAGTFDKDYHNSRNTMSKIVVKIKNASDDVRMKTIIK